MLERSWTGILLAVWAAAAAAAPATSVDEAAISTVMKAQFDKPDAPLAVSPVVAADGWGLAGWTQGEMGGLAILSKANGAWTIKVCASDSVAEPAALASFGMPASAAARLAAALREAEAGEPAERRMKFARFPSVVTMDGSKP